MSERKRNHTSMSRVSQTGQPAPSWTPSPKLSQLANECFQACINAHARPDLIRVFRNSGTSTHGRCYTEQRIIVINRDRCDPLPTLAHEIAHLRVKSHGPKHKALTEELLAWLRKDS